MKLVPNGLSSNGAAPLFEPIGRTDAELPKDFIPWAEVVLRASDELVRRATEECPPFSQRRRWKTDDFRSDDARIRIESNCFLAVFRCGKFYFLHRNRAASKPKREVVELLAYALGPGPICTHTREAAMRLAEYYHLIPAETAGVMQWLDRDMDNYSGHLLQPSAKSA